MARTGVSIYKNERLIIFMFYNGLYKVRCDLELSNKN